MGMLRLSDEYVFRLITVFRILTLLYAEAKRFLRKSKFVWIIFLPLLGQKLTNRLSVDSYHILCMFNVLISCKNSKTHEHSWFFYVFQISFPKKYLKKCLAYNFVFVSMVCLLLPTAVSNYLWMSTKMYDSIFDLTPKFGMHSWTCNQHCMPL